MTRRVLLREIAHVRAGEKGDLVNLAIVPYREEDAALVRAVVTEASIRDVFGPIASGPITVYSAPGSGALNVVIEGALDGGRSRNIVFDESGKALSGLALGMVVEVPDATYLRSERTTEGVVKDEPFPRGVVIGCATGWARDRFDAAAILIERGDLDYLCFETMSEVTMSATQVARRRDPSVPGFDPYLLERLVPVMAACQAQGVRVITNQGWTDPIGAARTLAEALSDAGLRGVRIAAIEGGDLMGQLADSRLRLEDGSPVMTLGDAVVSAETYLGASEISEAIADGADVVITSRVTDASLFVGPLMHELSLAAGMWDELAMAVTVGHLLECGAQVSGGYFADPGYKDVDGLATIGYPLAHVTADAALITKPLNTGGAVTPATCKEQLLYEVGDPGAYLNPDVTADFRGVGFRQVGRDRVRVGGFAGSPPPVTLKALVGVDEGWMNEQLVLYAGPGAVERAALAESVLVQRLAAAGVPRDRVRFDRVGQDAVHREATPTRTEDPYEVVLRVAMRGASHAEVDLLRREVDPIAATGPAGTGKWSPMGDMSRPVIGLRSAFVPRDAVTVRTVTVES
ncbi:MAG: acyclic terpene utilization AtuA family protein [Acidimicrobiia bacterium]